MKISIFIPSWYFFTGFIRRSPSRMKLSIFIGFFSVNVVSEIRLTVCEVTLLIYWTVFSYNFHFICLLHAYDTVIYLYNTLLSATRTCGRGCWGTNHDREMDVFWEYGRRKVRVFWCGG
jgi:hypothetical protein